MLHNSCTSETFKLPEINQKHLNFGGLQFRKRTYLIVIHHTGNPLDDDLSAGTIHSTHINRGWSGIGYHFVIRKDGTIEAGRPLDAIGAHAYGHNRYSIGIMLSGNFMLANPTSEQLHSTKKLITMLGAIYGKHLTVPMYRSIDGVLMGIATHRDLMPTLCPGNNFNLCDVLPDIEIDVKETNII